MKGSTLPDKSAPLDCAGIFFLLCSDEFLCAAWTLSVVWPIYMGRLKGAWANLNNLVRFLAPAYW